MKVKLFIAMLLIAIVSNHIKADAGMWLPLNITQNIKEMKKAGLKLSAEDIYSINKACLKDAVVGLSTEDNDFESFASASFISDKGLVVTNYHPMIRYLEAISKADRDFLKFGYWSVKPEEETNCQGLQVTQLLQMVDITTEILAGTEGLTENVFTEAINKKGKEISSRFTKGTKTEGKITSFIGGNQYVLSIYRIYKDVRMVAAPPMTLGKFAGDADN